MRNVSVRRDAVVRSIELVRAVEANYRDVGRLLENEKNSAGQNWNDDKFRQYAQIVDSCSGALNQPLADLKNCEQTLRRLLASIDAYQSTRL
ncbi:MAG: hypothetical protein ACOYJL_08100 [Tractidigestivibacter sp.]|jgi:hypothetical protein|uniref:hypothetical protein n=1 Tax=Tractidigestivibacter sp. TaxID=2847320 RepID=UPI003D950476